ncbi:MAG: DNA polymerase III subunit gamma/tau [Hyphomicrobiales bacterium]|nr:DNA polymerase III subunit gamma/tau [Hyphomicrobiales bacterium]
MSDTPASDTGSSLFGDLPSAPETGSAYRVLARKYRPQTFADLIGQEAMVRTLSNAFDTGRIPQAWMLTGVRGVGKTTTARILARGLNYLLPDGTGAPTIHMPVEGVHCRAIMESRHVDVLEMDAASHTGIDDVKQLTDGVRYSPASARYKVYIIDEVHMLSDKAFNAFLKTLEEPPPHAKFIFATTEIRKVPVTILSRCQRFDLRRVDADVLVAHLKKICAAELVKAEDDALALIARAAEGSVRDALSLLDQAIAHGAGTVEAETVRVMLGLADRARIIDLFDHLMHGRMHDALMEFKAQYDLGADPRQIIADLAEFSHFITRLKVVPDAAISQDVTEAERTRGKNFISLPMNVLSRAWQILLKGLSEIDSAPRPVTAAEMVLIRLAYAADLPTPDETLRRLKQEGANAPTTSTSSSSPSGGGTSARRVSNGSMTIAARGEPSSLQQSAPDAQAPQALKLTSFEALVALAHEKRDIALKTALERDLRLVRFEDGRMEFSPVDGASSDLAATISKRLYEWTNRRWVVAISSDKGQATLREKAETAKAEKLDDVRTHPIVKAAFAAFPGAEIVDIREVATRIEATDNNDELPEDGFDFTLLDRDDD